MPIISKVGRRSFSVRALLASIALLLMLGGVSMIYPLLLMVSGSTRGVSDMNALEVIPHFLYNDRALYQRYVESKYNVWLENARAAQHQTYYHWREVVPPGQVDHELVRLFDEFRTRGDFPSSWLFLGHSRGLGLDMWAANTRRFNTLVRDYFDNDINRARTELNLTLENFRFLPPPWEKLSDRRYAAPTGLYGELWKRLRESRPSHEFFFCDLDGFFREHALFPEYGSEIADYNRLHGTTHASYDQVLLTPFVPENGLGRDDWLKYVRDSLNGAFIRLAPRSADRYRQFLRKQHRDNLETLNERYGSSFGSFEQTPLPAEMPQQPGPATDWLYFIQHVAEPEDLRIHGPRQAWEQFLAERRNVALARVTPTPLPTAMADFVDMQSHQASLRWEFVTRHYRYVWSYVLSNGRGLYNTLVYCILSVGVQLLFNPLAAYALSRYKMPGTYQILLIFLVTMAFPPEVTMIPSFLLLRRFPLWPMISAAIAATVVMLVAALVLRSFHDRMDREKRAAWIVVAGILAGIAGWVWVWRIFGVARSDVSLLNTFYALILPELANGFSIFLLKGFFDSLPRELFEAAEIDGASEWTKFWVVTMSLSKPILAVLALGAFTSAYSNFMYALVLIPDQRMWTLMVWLYELQRYSHQSVVFASLVLAAVPTCLVFLLCQNIIMRGIVVPVEK